MITNFKIIIHICVIFILCIFFIQTCTDKLPTQHTNGTGDETIIGLVYTPNGKPASNVTVNLYSDRPGLELFNTVRPEPQITIKTNSKGIYTFVGLDPAAQHIAPPLLFRAPVAPVTLPSWIVKPSTIDVAVSPE